MKTLFSFLLLAAISCTAWAQDGPIFDLKGLTPDTDYDNIHVQQVGSDAHSTTFVIWVKEEVKPHYHKTHTETLYVIEGNGIMQLGDDGSRIGPGDLLIIPPNTVHSVEVTSDVPLKVLSVQAPEFHGKDRHFTEGE